jgi:hypothetical protein
MRIFCTYYPSQQHPIETSLINFSTSAKQNKNNIRFMAESIQQNILLSARCLKFSMQYTQLYIISWAHERLWMNHFMQTGFVCSSSTRYSPFLYIFLFNFEIIRKILGWCNKNYSERKQYAMLKDRVTSRYPEKLTLLWYCLFLA